MSFENEEQALKMIENRPQELCKMCGKCCKAVTTKFTHEQLMENFRNGDKQSIDFLSIFEPYSSLEEALEKEPEIVQNILNKTSIPHENLTFYRCKYIQDNGRCGNYEKRPTVCKLAPFTPWSIMPPHCGFEKWIEEQKAQKIQEIKHQKDNLQELFGLLEIAQTQEQIDEINKRINTTQEILKFYEKYGAEHW